MQVELLGSSPEGSFESEMLKFMQVGPSGTDTAWLFRAICKISCDASTCSSHGEEVLMSPRLSGMADGYDALSCCWVMQIACHDSSVMIPLSSLQSAKC